MPTSRKLSLAVLIKGAAGLGLVSGALLLNGCAVERYFLEYRVNVQQGNVVEQKNIAQLRPGMTRDQVRYVLGTRCCRIHSTPIAGITSTAMKMAPPALSPCATFLSSSTRPVS